MPKTTVDVDAALLTHAQDMIGSGSPAHTVDRALAELIGHRRRAEAVEAEIARFTTGHYAALAASAVRA